MQNCISPDLLQPLPQPNSRWIGWICGCLLLLFCSRLAAGEPLAAEAKPTVRAIRDLVYRDVDGVAIKADVFRPANDQVYPLVLMIHGGAWSSGDKRNLLNHCHEMANAGFVAVSINYRLAPLHRYPAQIEDCRVALNWVEENAVKWQADPLRIAVWGYSAGAHLAGLLVTHPQSGEPPLCAAVLGGAPCEFSFVPASSPVLSPVMGGTRDELPEVYRAASPIAFASQDTCPTFFFHGSRDAIVPPSSSRSLYTRLTELGVECEYYSVQGHGHIVSFFDPQARRLAIEFLQKHIPASP